MPYDKAPKENHPSPRGKVKPFPVGQSHHQGASGALFIDRQAGLVREICSSSVPTDAVPLTRLRQALDRLRRVDARIGVASHNRADSWDAFNVGEITAMNARIEATLGPIDLWCVCLVGDDGTCACSEPASGVLATGARAVGVGPERCAILTEEGRMSDAAHAVGVPAVPHPKTAGVALADAPDRLSEAADQLCRVVEAFLVVHTLDTGHEDAAMRGAVFN